MSCDDVVIVAAYRTPIGSFNGSLASLKADQLGTFVLKEILQKTNTFPDEVIIGQALTASQGQNPARQTSINAGCPNSVPAFTINMLCGSGLKACVLGYQAIKCGDAKVVVCGGQESMSQAPHCVHMRNGCKMNDVALVDSMIKDGLTDAFLDVHMGKTADHVAEKFCVTREQQDNHALESQMKYKQACVNFENEIGEIVVLL
jgi:acetyl-CoA C-acetyltransferase